MQGRACHVSTCSHGLQGGIVHILPNELVSVATNDVGMQRKEVWHSTIIIMAGHDAMPSNKSVLLNSFLCVLTSLDSHLGT